MIVSGQPDEVGHHHQRKLPSQVGHRVEGPLRDDAVNEGVRRRFDLGLQSTDPAGRHAIGQHATESAMFGRIAGDHRTLKRLIGRSVQADALARNVGLVVGQRALDVVEPRQDPDLVSGRPYSRTGVSPGSIRLVRVEQGFVREQVDVSRRG